MGLKMLAACLAWRALGSNTYPEVTISKPQVKVR